MINIYWKIFFAAYWLSYDLGEKETPHINASWFMELTLALILFSFLFIAEFINGKKISFFIAYVITFMAFSFLINEYILFSKKIGFKNHIEKYRYFTRPENKKQRNKIVILTAVITFFLLIVSTCINNPTIKTLLYNK